MILFPPEISPDPSHFLQPRPDGLKRVQGSGIAFTITTGMFCLKRQGSELVSPEREKPLRYENTSFFPDL
jgi:hypothetical protein